MQRRLNLKLLLWSVGLLMSAVLIVHFIHTWQMRGNAGAVRDQAERAVGVNDFARAAALFQYYVDYMPDDAAAQERYVFVLEHLSQTPPTRLKTAQLLEQLLRRQ